MKRLKQILLIVFLLDIVIPTQLLYAQTQSNHGMFYRSLADNGLLNGLVSCWDFEETSGTTAYDSHGNNDATINGSPTFSVAGKIGNQYGWDGIDDYIQTSSNIITSAPFSVSFWGKDSGDNDAGKTPRVTTHWVNNAYYGAHITGKGNYNGKVVVELGDGGSPISTSRRSGTFGSATLTPVTGWYHVVVVVNGYDDVTGYINGVQYTWTATSGTGSSLNLSSGVLLTPVGWANLINVQDCDIDQVAVWSRALTASDALALYNLDNGLPYVDFTAQIKLLYDNLLQRNYNIQTPLRIAS